MKKDLKRQVVDFRSAVRLNKIGVPQQSVWYWVVELSLDKKDVLTKLCLKGTFDSSQEIYSAFTTEELRKYLKPIQANGYMHYLEVVYTGKWVTAVFTSPVFIKGTKSRVTLSKSVTKHTEAMAIATVVIDLFEKGYIENA